jgi:hypothetical protein
MTAAMRRAGVGAVALVAALGSVACSNSHDGQSSARGARATATTSATTVTSMSVERDGAIAGWQRYVAGAVVWNNPPNPGDPHIPLVVASSSLRNYREDVAIERAKRIARRPAPLGPPAHHTTVLNETATGALLQDCFIDDFVAYNYESGAVVDDGVATRTLRVEMVIEGGAWKVKTIQQLKSAPGRHQCVD